MKISTGEVWLAELRSNPTASYTFEIVASIKTGSGVRWLGIKHIDDETLFNFPGNQMYLFDSDGFSECTSPPFTRFRLTSRSKKKTRYRQPFSSLR